MSTKFEKLPNRFIVDVTWDCNLKCKMCVKRTINKPYGQKDVSVLKDIVNRLHWAKEICIGALGDPFMYKGLEEALEFLHDKNISSPLTSNGTTINKKNINLLPQHNPLFISIDAGSDKIYRGIRGCSISKVKETLTMIKKVRPDIGLTINYILFNHNILDAKKLIDFISELGDIGISYFFPMYFNSKVEREMSAFNLGNDLIIQMIELARYTEDKEVRFTMTSPYMEQRFCIRPFSQPIIAYDGTVYPCDYVYQDMNNWKHPMWKSWYLGKSIEVPQYQYKMGNIFEEDLRRMWRSEKWKKLRTNLIKLRTVPLNKTYEEILEETDLSIPLEHCKVCLARWSRCL